MSKHLLYCKDLLNGTLVRGFRFVLTRLNPYLLNVRQNDLNKLYRAKHVLSPSATLRINSVEGTPSTQRKTRTYIPNLGALCAFARDTVFPISFSIQNFKYLWLVFCLISVIQAVSPAEAAGPLSVKPTNPSYFFDPKGKSVYLTGSYLNEYNTLSGSLDFASYLDFLQQQKQNFTRVWGWEQSPWIYDNTGEISFSSQPYERTGPGLALDGGLKFDLTRFNQAYFDQLRSRVAEAAQRGIYVSVMLFEGFSTQKKMGRVNPWLGDPFQQVNNINGINGDPNRNGGNEEFFSLAFPSLVSLQEAFARKVVDTLNDLDNILYEVNGNGLAGSLSWQYHMIDYIKHYQKKPANQHPVGISDFYAGATADVFNSSAEWIVIPETNLNPPAGNTKKVLIMEGTPPLSGGQAISTLPISLVQLLPDNVVSTQSSGTWNDGPSSNGVTLVSSSATSSTLTTTKSASKQSQVATPTITPNGGVYSGTVPVTLQTATPGASIYYTTDGQSPTQSSRLYSGKFTLSQSTLVKATAFKKNFDPSSEASAWFANAASTAVGPSGLVAYWKFDEGSGTTAADVSGNGNTGTLMNGPLWTAGRVGNGLYFDGIDDNITVPDSNSLDLSSSFTLSAWVNPASTFTDFRSILVKNYKYYLYASVVGYCGDGSPLGGFSEGTNTTVCQPSPLPINTWTHLALTYNGSTLTFYRNGVAVVTSNVAGALSPTTGTLQIGASQFGEYFKGLIDEVRIYNRALNDTEIQTLYQQDSGTPVQTVATPVISPNGGSYNGSVSITMQTATSGASIYYTTDGSTPTQSSTLYTGALNLTSSATVKAKAFKSGSNPSAEASASFTVTQPFNFSVSNSGGISVVAGSSVTNSINTTLTSGSAQAVTFSALGLPTGATASFSSSSCSPTCSSTMTINASNSMTAGSSTITVTASGGGVTKTTTFSLTVSLPTLATVATPTITPNGGSFTSSVSVTMQTATSGAAIYYTTDGSSPTQSSTLYTGSTALTTNETVKAKAFKSGSNASAEASALFTITQPFGFSLSNSGDLAVTAGSSITNSISTTLTSGSAQAVTFSASGLPTGATASFSSTSCSPACSSTLTINTSSSIAAGSSNVTVTATGGGVTKTTIFSLTVSLPTVATPAINPNGGSYTGSAFVAMQTATAGALIYYTTDGSTPTQSSTLYAGAITLTSSAVVKAKAFKSGYNASAEASASFNITPTGLVAYWKFDEGSGTTVSDSSGNGNTGTLMNGPLWTAGRVGNGLYFDGIDDNITVPDSNSLDLSSAFTLSAWVNPASTFTDFRSIFAKNYTYYLYASVAGYCGDGSPLGGFEAGGAVCQPSPLPINTWTQLAVTYNGSTLTLYRNGVAVATSNASGTLSATTGTLQIGASQFGEYFQGFIDEVRIYNRTLSNTEIQAIYQQDSVAASQTVATSVSQPFNFALSNSGDKSVVAGSSVTNSIATALISGSSQAVSFSVSGLPVGATGSFSSTGCNPSCSTVLNIVTTGSTPAGNFPITVTSAGGGVTKTTAFTLSVTLALTVATPTITPNGGNFSGSTSVTMQTATSGASIYYTTDGSTPSQSSQLYTGAMNVTSDTAINAQAFKSGYNPSSVASASFTMAAIAQQPTTGKVYYVATNGSDSNPGTISQPFKTIKRGIASLAGGDTLRIRAGTYDERLTNASLINQGLDGTGIPNGSGEASRTTLVAADGPGTVIILPSSGIGILGWPNIGGPFQYMTFDGIIFDGMNIDAGISSPGNISSTQIIYLPPAAQHMRFTNVTVRNGGFASGDGSNHNGVLGVTIAGAQHIEFLNSTFTDNGRQLGDPAANQGNTASAYHFYITGGDDLIIDGCTFARSGGYAIHAYSGNQVTPTNMIIRNSVFVESGITARNRQMTAAIRVGGGVGNMAYNNLIYGGYSMGIEAVSANPVVYNNTIYGNGSWGIYVNPNSIVRNNIVYNNALNQDGSTDIGGFNLSGSVVSNNLCGQTSTVTPSGACVVVGNPNFINAATSDFHLQGGSPAVNAGVTLTQVTTDIAGTPRPQGPAYDIGAFEYR